MDFGIIKKYSKIKRSREMLGAAGLIYKNAVFDTNRKPSPAQVLKKGDRRKFCVIDDPRQYENLRLSQE
jgi:hypothetical protein